MMPRLTNAIANNSDASAHSAWNNSGGSDEAASQSRRNKRYNNSP